MARPTATEARRRACRRARHDQHGSLALEAAMALPVVALCAFGLLGLVGVARDALLAQDLARIGARTAATEVSEAAIVGAVESAADGVATEVRITPTVRGPGDLITIEVDVTRADAPLGRTVTGRAVIRGEPVLDRAGPP